MKHIANSGDVASLKVPVMVTDAFAVYLVESYEPTTLDLCHISIKRERTTKTAHLSLWRETTFV